MIPELGFGTWRLSGRECEEGVADALAAGYRHIDTAAMYDNEEDVGRGLRAAGVDRSDVWVTTKVWTDALEPERLRASLERSLRRLALEHVDLLLIHWPSRDVPLERTLAAMSELREAGWTREIGVSNFPSAMFREALGLAPVIVNQVEYHPFLSAEAVLEVCEQHDVELTAYRPLAKGKVGDDPVIREVAETHGKTRGPGGAALADRAAARVRGAKGIQSRAPAREPRRFRLRAIARGARSNRCSAEGPARGQRGLGAGVGLGARPLGLRCASRREPGPASGRRSNQAGICRQPSCLMGSRTTARAGQQSESRVTATRQSPQHGRVHPWLLPFEDAKARRAAHHQALEPAHLIAARVRLAEPGRALSLGADLGER